MDKNPFSLYDFLGYFIPGALCLFLTYKAFTLPLDITLWNTDLLLRIPIKNDLVTLFIVIVCSYTIGHILSYFSSITIERYANKQYGYPSVYLLKDIDKSKSMFRLLFDNTTDQTWKSILRVSFCRLMLLFILAPFSITDLIIGRFFGLRDFFIKKLDPAQIAWFTAKQMKMLQIYNLDQGAITEDCDIHRIIHHYIYESVGKQHFKFDNYVALYGFLRSVTFSILMFYFIFTYRYGVNYVLVWLLIVTALVLFFSLYPINNSIDNTPNVDSISFQQKVKSLVLVLFCLGVILIALFSSIFDSNMVLKIYSWMKNLYPYVSLSFVCLLMCYISFMGFMKFYRRYTLLAFMCLIVDKTLIEERSQNV